MKTENIILVIFDLIILIIFIPLAIWELKKYLRNKEEQLIKQINPMLAKDESLKEYSSYHQQCLYTIQYLLKEMTNEDGSKCFDELEGNYFDPFVPYFENKVKK